MSVARTLLAAALVAQLAGCTTLSLLLRPPKQLPVCPGFVMTTDAIEGAFVWREQVRYVGRGVDAGFDLVVEKREGELVLVGFNEFGAEAFSVVQRGTVVEVASDLGPALAVPPENVLRDLHRLRFGAPAGEGVSIHGEGGRTVVTNPACDSESTWVHVSTG